MHINRDVGDFGRVIGEVDVVCMSIGMKNRVLDNCRTSRIKVHTRRMLRKLAFAYERGEGLEFSRGMSLLGGWGTTMVEEGRGLVALLEINFPYTGTKFRGALFKV